MTRNYRWLDDEENDLINEIEEELSNTRVTRSMEDFNVPKEMEFLDRNDLLFIDDSTERES